MNIKEILKTNEQLNGKDKKKRIVLIFIASLFAMAAAIYSVFHNRKSDKADEAKSDKVRRQSRMNKASASKKRHAQTISKRLTSAQGKETSTAVENTVSSAVQQPVVTVPQQVYIVRPLPKEKQESKTHRFKRHMCAAVAVILVVSLVGSGAMNYSQPTTVLAAKGSFSGISRIVEEHGEDNPYVILDIVPSKAIYKDNNGVEYGFSTGTMGYLVSGQAAIVQDIQNVLNNRNFYNYKERQKLLSAVTNGGDGFPDVLYKEAYAGVDDISSGWTLMFDVAPAESGSSSTPNALYPNWTSNDGPNGLFTGRVTRVENGQGNFAMIYAKSDSEFSKLASATSLLNGDFYLSNPGNGEYQVLFGAIEASDETEGGYVVQDTIDPNDAADASYVYILNNDGIYEYWGTVEAWRDMIEGAKSAYEESIYENEKEVESSEGLQDESVIPTEPTVDEGNDSAFMISAPVSNRWYKLAEVAPIDGDNEDNSGGDNGDNNGGDNGDNNGGDNEDNNGGDNGDNNGGDNGDNSGGDNGDDSGGDNGDDSGGDNGDNSGGDNDVTDDKKDGENPSEDDETNSDDENEEPKVDDEEEPKEDKKESDKEPQVEIDWDSFWSRYEKYKVLTFEYRYKSDFVEGQQLYDIIAETPSEGSPFDAYDLINGENDAEDNDIALLGLGLDFPVMNDSSNGSDVDGVFSYVGEGKGNYKIERVSGGSEDTERVGTVEVRNASIYYRCSTSRDWLKEYVFCTLSDGDNSNDNFEIEVRTVRADEVTSAMISEADMVYLESGDGNTVLKTDDSVLTLQEGVDIDGLAVAEILRRAAVDYMPIIVDYDIVKKFDDSNYQYLAKAMLKRDLAGFYDAINGNDLMANLRMNITSDDYPDKTDNKFNYVNQNVYIVSGSPLVAEDFRDEFDDDTARAGFSDVLSTIKAENTMRSEEDKISEKVSKARAVQYIINFSVGIVGELSDLNILELQPTANSESDLYVEGTGDGGAKLVWKTPSMTTAKQVLNSKNSFSIARKDVKSVVEFNSEWEDINGIYDFVFIGLDGQKLNVNGDGRPVYNNHSLDGKVYHKGDTPYDANDITDQKMMDLIEFMAAGYPVLVENDCFKDGTAQKASGSGDINTGYIGSDTTMYQFLRAALDEYRDYIYTVSDAMAGSMFITQVKMARPRISLVADENGSDYNQYLSEDENGEYHGRIAYAVTSNKSNDDSYDDYYGNTVVRLYADVNYDGIYAKDEEVTEYTNDGGIIDLEVTGMGPGILPWKLEVSDENNSNRRDSVEGYFVIGSSATSAKGELNVLQIMANTDDGNANLQTMFHKSTNSMLANYLSGAEGILHTDMQFESVTPAELELQLGDNENYLEQWDVVVVTLEGLDLGNTADALQQYVDKGRSLLVCGSASSGDNRAGLTAALLGQTDERTFVDLGVISEFQRYAGLDGGMYDPVGGVQAERVNNGSISYYPYAIGEGSVDIGAAVAVKASAYLLDFDNNLKSDGPITYVTPWYTIGGGSNTAYGISPRDGRNNYYCYSKGNVVYLAQSGYPYAVDDGMGDGECKFFVNALVAAYSAGVHNANVHIVAGFASDSADVESIAVPFDDVWLEADDEGTGGILDNTVDVYFRFRDSNIAMNKTVKIEFLYEDSTGPEFDVGGKTVNAQQFESPIWMVENNRLTLVQPDQLEPGKTYRIQAPVVTLQNDSSTNKADIYIVIESSFIRNGRDYNVISSDYVSLNRAQLFLLE